MTSPSRRRARISLGAGLSSLLALFATTAQASFLSGETLDATADVLAWVVLVIVPIVGIAVFWLVHILPEKIAEQRRHPQAKAIQTLCLLSLVFGGMLWPFAWLWAYSKPVLYKMAYGTDVGDETHGAPATATTEDATAASEGSVAVHSEIAALRQQLASLESRVRQEARG